MGNGFEITDHYHSNVMAPSPHVVPYYSPAPTRPSSFNTTPGIFQSPNYGTLKSGQGGRPYGMRYKEHPSSPLPSRVGQVSQLQPPRRPSFPPHPSQLVHPHLHQQQQYMMMHQHPSQFVEYGSPPTGAIGLERRASVHTFSPGGGQSLQFFPEGIPTTPQAHQFAYSTPQGSPMSFVSTSKFLPGVITTTATPGFQSSLQATPGSTGSTPTTYETSSVANSTRSSVSIAAASASAAALAVAAGGVGFSTSATKRKASKAKLSEKKRDKSREAKSAELKASTEKPEVTVTEIDVSRVATPSNEPIDVPRTPPPPEQRSHIREEGADLLMFLATSPSPARRQLKKPSKSNGAVSPSSASPPRKGLNAKNSTMTGPQTPQSAFNFHEYLNIFTPSPRKAAGSVLESAKSELSTTKTAPSSARLVLNFDQSPLFYEDGYSENSTNERRMFNNSSIKSSGSHRRFPSGDLFVERALLYQSRMCVSGAGISDSSDIAGELLDSHHYRLNGANNNNGNNSHNDMNASNIQTRGKIVELQKGEEE